MRENISLKPRVLQLIDSFQIGGSERQAVQLARLLRQSGRFEVFVACLNDFGPLREELKDIGEIPEYKLKSFYDFGTLPQVSRFVRHLKSLRIDIIQTHDFYTNIFGMISGSLAGMRVRIASRR